MSYGTVIGYVYDAGIHCIACADKRFGCPATLDNIDSEGNLIGVYLSGQHTNDAESDVVCDDCFDVIWEVA